MAALTSNSVACELARAPRDPQQSITSPYPAGPRKNNRNSVACELARAPRDPQQSITRPYTAGPRKNNRNSVACELARASETLSPAQRAHTTQARASADATQDLSALSPQPSALKSQPSALSPQVSSPLLDELQFAAIDQMRQAIASHIGIEAFGL